MDAWDQARQDIIGIANSGWAPHAMELYIGRVLQTLETAVRADQTRPPAGICRTCGTSTCEDQSRERQACTR
jgi:hypothetical protein